MGLLSKASAKIVSESASAYENAEESNTLEGQIAQYHQSHAYFNCVVLEIPDSAEKANFCESVSGIIHTAGIVISLPSGHPLILLPITMDRELIAHRLSKSLSTGALQSFEAKSPKSVLSRIQSLI